MATDAMFEQLREQNARTRERARKLLLEGQALGQKLQETVHSLADMTSRTRHTMRDLKNEGGREAIYSLARVPSPESASIPDTGIARMLAGLSDADFDQLADRLISAYEDAQIRGDEAAQRLIKTALYQVGYSLAARIGPRASGIVLN